MNECTFIILLLPEYCNNIVVLLCYTEGHNLLLARNTAAYKYGDWVMIVMFERMKE